MSRLPSRADTKMIPRPSGIQAGLVFKLALSVMRLVLEPSTSTIQIALGDAFPYIEIATEDPTNEMLPRTYATLRPSGDQVGELAENAVSNRRDLASARSRIQIALPSTKTMDLPSGDHDGMSPRSTMSFGVPPSAGT